MEHAKAMAKTASREGARKKSRLSDLSSAAPMNRSLHAAKTAKQDEFYTQYVDIQKEVEAYLEFDPDTFRDKVLYCNCDDGSPIAGQGTLFPEYDEGNDKRQKPKALAVVLNQVKDENGDGAADVTDVELFLKRNKAARIALKGNEEYPGGDFRSSECIDLLKEADIVVTNPPFSLFREYVAQLVEFGKKFVIVGPKNAVTYKEIFPLIKDSKLWLGSGFANGNAYFSIPAESRRDFADGVYDESTGLVKFRNVGWFTNLDHGRRHQELPLMTMADNLKFSKHKEIKGKVAYDRYANYDAIEVPYTDAIPSDYDGDMGVPITFLDKHNPDQFEILGITKTWFGAACKSFPNQIQIDKDGTQTTVSKLNDQPAMRVEEPPTGQTYYIVDGQYYIALYQRILIRRRSRPARKTKK